MAVPALLWNVAPGGTHVRCLLCPHACLLREGASGRCRVRKNLGGALVSFSSDCIAAVNLDPVEKKPLYHFLPGTTTFSLGTPGCTMSCAFCQNHTLSQQCPSAQGEVAPLSASRIAAMVDSAVGQGAKSIAFTYNEPTVSIELVHAVAPRASEAGLPSVLVSNAFFSRAALDLARHLVRAANFDLKSFSNGFYTQYCGARLAPVLDTIVAAAGYGWWVELTTLLIPGLNDSDEELRRIAAFIRTHLGRDVPWHLSRFRPMYKMRDIPPTPVATLERARAIGIAEGLRFVYTGNVPGHDGESSYCPDCGDMVIRRRGYRLAPPVGHACGRCGFALPGVWA